MTNADVVNEKTDKWAESALLDSKECSICDIARKKRMFFVVLNNDSGKRFVTLTCDNGCHATSKPIVFTGDVTPQNYIDVVSEWNKMMKGNL